uniref:Coagulation factor XI-like n=1 Tax=Fundulus heteroclitus TaxID=8078 RepID=A0A3Q2P288_FUNHE
RFYFHLVLGLLSQDSNNLHTYIQIIYSPDAEHCQHLCTHHPSCQFFAFIGPDCTVDRRHFHCFLKSTLRGTPVRQNQKQGTTAGYSLKLCYPDPKPCLSRIYDDVDFPGSDYRTFFTADYKECQRACTDDPSCQFFSFLILLFSMHICTRNQCHLKFSWTVPRTPNIRALGDRISGFSQRMQATMSLLSECKGTLYPNTDFPGRDFEILPTVSAEHCQALCSAHPRCTHFSHIRSTFRCYLKNNPGQMIPKPVGGITSGLPARSCQLDDSWIKVVHVGIDFPSSDIRRFSLNNVGSCQKSCTEDPNCQFYSYIPTRRLCFLKRIITLPTPPKVTEQTNAVSGFSLRNCR